jgi:hypothetical protein
MRKNLIFGLGLFLSLLLLTGCGKKAAPFLPAEVRPKAPADLAFSIKGEKLVLEFTLPRENTDGTPVPEWTGISLMRGDLSFKEAPEECKGCPPPPLKEQRISLSSPALTRAGDRIFLEDDEVSYQRDYYYRVQVHYLKGRPSLWSQLLKVAWDQPPARPQNLKSQGMEGSVEITWDAPDGPPVPTGYLVSRREGRGNWESLTPVPLNAVSYRDPLVKTDMTYTYQVRAARLVRGTLLKSEPADTPSLALKDYVSPPTPRGLLALPAAEGVELRWEASLAPDLAGYRVYRKKPGEKTWQLLFKELITGTQYLDRSVKTGEAYQYTVTAVDKSPQANESAHSEGAAIFYQR